MNERIQQLAEQCRIETYGVNGELLAFGFDEEKFAELIVRECVELVEGYTKQRTHTTFYKAEEQIKQHFGVEE